MSKTLWANAGTIGAALLASSCCIGPVLFAILGLGAFGAGSLLERFRPIFIVLTFLILGIAFYLTYRKRTISCADGLCEVHGVSKWNKLTLWAITIFALTFLTFPEWSPILLNAQTEVSTMNQTVTLNVSGMTCGGCALTVQKALETVPGVKSSAVDFETGTASVSVGASIPSSQSLISAVETAGYKAVLVDRESKSMIDNNDPPEARP